MDLHGVGPVVAAHVLADVGDVRRFADRNRFASWTGTAPLDASSRRAEPTPPLRRRNRRINHMIHILRDQPDPPRHRPARPTTDRERAEGKKPLEASRCLKRRISDAIYRQLLDDAQPETAQEPGAGPGGHCGATLQSSAADLLPHIDNSDQSLPGPARKTLRRTGCQQEGAGKTQPQVPSQPVPGKRLPRRTRTAERSGCKASAVQLMRVQPCVPRDLANAREPDPYVGSKRPSLLTLAVILPMLPRGTKGTVGVMSWLCPKSNDRPNTSADRAARICQTTNSSGASTPATWPKGGAQPTQPSRNGGRRGTGLPRGRPT